MIVSVSGIRGILNADMSLADVVRFSDNFASLTGSAEVLIARDTRRTSPILGRAVTAALVGRGVAVVDFGAVSTPALFRESLQRGKPAVMVTASHNEPEYNGLKFIIDGRGIGKDAFERVTQPRRGAGEPVLQGRVRKATARYVDDLVKRFGQNSCQGVKVALDLGGGAAIAHAVPLLRRLGCEVTSVNDTPGVFSRRIDPTADGLELLRRLVKAKDCDIGLAFDCDGDRLVIVDSAGRKRAGDYMLTLALAQLLAESKEENVVVSVDTTQAVDIVAARAGARVLRSKVGEANVVGMMTESGARFGGEGSSGGLVDGSFNYCRDSLLAALVIIRALRHRRRKLYDDVRSFHQSRAAIQAPRAKALRAIETLASKNPGADRTDGLKLWLSRRSWVLIRVSGTEDSVRVSAEAEAAGKAAQITQTFSNKLKELCR